MPHAKPSDPDIPEILVSLSRPTPFQVSVAEVETYQPQQLDDASLPEPPRPLLEARPAFEHNIGLVGHGLLVGLTGALNYGHAHLQAIWWDAQAQQNMVSSFAEKVWGLSLVPGSNSIIATCCISEGSNLLDSRHCI